MMRRTLPLLMAGLLSLQASPVGALAPNSVSDTDSIQLLRQYQILRGSPDGALHLDQRVTRAEAAAMFVRAMGAEDQAATYSVATLPFGDTVAHWGAGYVGAAVDLKLLKGYPDGTFQPDAQITYAELLTVLLRMTEQEPSGAWSRERIAAAASALDIVDDSAPVTEAATRMTLARSLAPAISRVPLKNGRTVMQTYLDQIAAGIVLESSHATTTDAQLTVKGTAPDAWQVHVNGQLAALNPLTGEFSRVMSLEMGEQSLLIEAVDAAGNRATATMLAERLPVIARLEVTGAAVVDVGGTAHLTVQAYDASGQTAPTKGLHAMMVTTTGSTFDMATGTLSGGTAMGEGELRVSAGAVSVRHPFQVVKRDHAAAQVKITKVNNGVAPGLGKQFTVTVEVQDQDGKTLTADQGRPVTLSAAPGLEGVTISPAAATTSYGVATFKVQANHLGSGNLVAISDGLTTGVSPVNILTPLRIMLSAYKQELPADGATLLDMSAYLVDDQGRNVPNTTGADILVDLNATGTDATWGDSRLTIPKGGYAASGARLQMGVETGTLRVEGQIAGGGPPWSVTNLSIPVTGNLPGSRLVAMAPRGSTLRTNAQIPITVKIQDKDGKPVYAGAYAFQLRIWNENGDGRDGGLPEGAEVWLAGTDLRPVPERLPSDDPNIVVGRTLNGEATVYLKVTKPGKYTVMPIKLPASHEAHSPYHDAGAAASSMGLGAQGITITVGSN